MKHRTHSYHPSLRVGRSWSDLRLKIDLQLMREGKGTKYLSVTQGAECRNEDDFVALKELIKETIHGE